VDTSSGSVRELCKDRHSGEISDVFGILLIVVLGTSIWAGFDAQALISKGADKKSLGGGPVAIFLGCLLVWIIVFSYYLVKRSNVRRI
jgi:hypothetical protein